MSSEAYTFSRNCKVVQNANRIILGNERTGEWIKISKQCFDILNLGIENSMSPTQLVDCLEDREDKLYFQELFDKLQHAVLLEQKDGGNLPGQTIHEIYFALTNKCNLHCAHCCYNAEYTSLCSPEEARSTGEMITVIDKIIAANPKNIVFSGGEPMLRSDFFEILKYTSKEFNGSISLSTNATFITSRNVKDLIRYVDSFDISLDGVDDKSCSLLRGRGVFDKVMDSIQLLQKFGAQKIALSMVVTDRNAHLENEFRELNKRLGTKPVVRQFNPIGRGKKYKNSRYKEKPIDVKLSDEQIKQFSDLTKMSTCAAGRKTLLIDYDGSIYPCGLLISENYKLAQIDELDHLDQLQEDPLIEANIGFQSLNNLKPDRYHKCKDCSVNLFCWNCIQRVEGYEGYDELFEERCAAQKKFLERVIWGIEEVSV